MAYVAARGGEQAIQKAEQLFQQLNGVLGASFVRSIEQTMPYLVDRVMGEASLYAPELAALALAQAGGDLYEAVLLLRAYRSTQPRIGYAQLVDETTTTTIRRISAAFKDIPGGQILGPTLDYSHRILRTEILDQNPEPRTQNPEPETLEQKGEEGFLVLSSRFSLPPVADWLRQNGLLETPPAPEAVDVAELPDLTRDPIAFPASRGHRLQSLARADTGGILALGYASMRGYGLVHPTVNEVRLGYADVQLRHPISGAVFSAGRMRVSSAEIVSNATNSLELGYAATIGWNEVKVIAAAMLDVEMSKPTPHPAHDEEFVLSHTEPVEGSGFCIHFKLPHYVTFSSTLDTLRRVRGEAAADEVKP